MKRIAVVFSTQSGHTRKISERVAELFRAKEIDVELFDLAQDEAPSAETLQEFEAVVLGCPVNLGDFSPLLVDWTWDCREALSQIPSGLITVSLNAADPRPKARAVDDKVLRNFIDETDLRPRFVASVAGALQYTQYGFFKRCVLQGVSAACGGPTDTSRDFDLTKWADVDAFAEAFLAQDLSSDFATVNRLPIAPLPSWPMGQRQMAA